MSRSERLLRLSQLLYQRRYPASGKELAETLNISLRTLYRDIASLRASGAHIEGEAGVGYVMKPGYFLPPLMFSPAEAEALVLGIRWVKSLNDRQLAQDAANVLARIEAVIPEPLRHQMDINTLMIPSSPGRDCSTLPQIRDALRQQKKLQIRYMDKFDRLSERTVWPFALGFIGQHRILAAWCEERRDFRHFLLNRLQSVDITTESYPENKMQLLKRWRALGLEKIPADNI